MTFKEPIIFLPGDTMLVHLSGSEDEYYKQNFELTYRIFRAWSNYSSILGYLTLPQPGFDTLDWQRLQNAGLVVQDLGRHINGGTDAIYGSYYGDPKSRVYLNFWPCYTIGGELYDYIRGNYDGERNRIRVDVPSGGGQILVKTWNDGRTLMTCDAH